MTGAESPTRSDLALRSAGSPSAVFDRVLYALFSRHADRARHDGDRKQYRGTDLRVSFGVYVARVYGISWLSFVALTFVGFALGMTVPDQTVAGVNGFLQKGIPVLNRLSAPSLPRTAIALVVALAVGGVGKRATVALGSRYLSWLARARRASIRRTLPGAVRYLHALSTGSGGQRAMLRKVANNRNAYGETAVAVRKALNKAALTGSLDEGLRIVARDTPSRNALAPFLMKFREHADQGADELASYLRLESRMLSHRQQRSREQAAGFLELIAELFIVLLVLPALLVIVLTVMSVLSPELNRPLTTPLGSITTRGALVYGSAGFVLVVGGLAAGLVGAFRPPGQSLPSYRRPGGTLATLRTIGTNPSSAVVVSVPFAATAAGFLWWLSYDLVNVALLGYAAFAIPVGLVAARRARLDDAKDREIKDFIHAVSGHVSLGRPFSEATAIVARDVDLGALDDDVADLAFNANLTTYDGDLRTAALDRFVERVGTPLAEQTMGLVTGALDAGSDAEDVFDTLQTEVGRLYHEKKALRDSMLVYVAVGWTTALLVVGIVVAVDGYVIDGFTQLSSVSSVSGASTLDPNAIEPARERQRFYVVTQATMLASGWFAGMANRGRYDALLHSGLLVCIAYVVFSGVGMT
ncbi:type II secretion system F family protein [Halostella pelagica]|uniref:type II secretion system F family protein n=1 Tax=Halostella pelagica TaxID=2583824 RepID=UPI001080E593|nr:type II secretion system F family protein [Halostella pelagica]